jgi:hypothetical protein
VKKKTVGSGLTREFRELKLMKLTQADLNLLNKYQEEALRQIKAAFETASGSADSRYYCQR